MQRHRALEVQPAVLAVECSTRAECVPRVDSTQPGGKKGREVPRADTVVGVLRSVVSPTPSPPAKLLPKHSTLASLISAQVWESAPRKRAREWCGQQQQQRGSEEREGRTMSRHRVSAHTHERVCA